MSFRDIAIFSAARSSFRLLQVIRRPVPYFVMSTMAIGLLTRPVLADEPPRINADPIVAPSEQIVIPDRGIRGSLNAGFNAAAGDISSYDFIFNGDARWATETDKITGTATVARGNKRDANGKSVMMSNRARSLVQYDHDLTPLVYSLAFIELETSKLRNLAFRGTLGAGLGRHVIRSEDIAFDVFGGVSYTYEKYQKTDKHPAVQRRYPEIVLGESLSYRINASTQLTQRFAVYPNLDRINRFRTQFDLGVSTALSKRLQLKATLTNSYYNKPAAGGKRMNTMLMTTVGYVFGLL